MKKKLLAMALAACCLVGMCACAQTPGGEDGDKPGPRPEHLGLYVEEDGTMMFDGEKFYGVGINYYSMLNNSFVRPKYDVTEACTALEFFAEYDVKVVRFNLGWYNSKEWKDFLDYDQETKHLEALDKIVAKAEELGIGLIPSFAWNPPAICDAFDEPVNTALSRDYSKTMTWFLGFTKRVVQRYAESPAIYAWEYGNEQNLSSSVYKAYRGEAGPLPPWSERDKRTEEDYTTFEAHSKVLDMFAETVYNNDPYHRFISSGDAGLRPQTWHWMHNREGVDSKEQFEEVVDMVVPGHVSAISTHEYADKNSGFGYAMDYLDGNNAIKASNFTDYFNGYLEQGARTKTAVYMGETGYLPDPGQASEEHCVEVIEAVLQAALETNFPLVMLWNYDPRTVYDPNDHTKFTGGIDKSWNEKFIKGRGFLEAIKKYNKLMADKHAAQAPSGE